MSDLDDIRNKIEREAESRFPGYVGPRWGELTLTPSCPNFTPVRTQVVFEGAPEGNTLWLDAPCGSILVGDEIMIAEREKVQIVVGTGTTIPGEYFELPTAIPHKFGTLISLQRKGNHNG
jgi:hypothetical protein